MAMIPGSMNLQNTTSGKQLATKTAHGVKLPAEFNSKTIISEPATV